MTPKAVADYCVQLHRRNTDALGFIQAPRILEYAERGQIYLEKEGGDACGFLILGRGDKFAPIYQACIEQTLRNLGHGREIVERVSAVVLERGQDGVYLRCRNGLEANEFWRALGFRVVSTVPGGSRRGLPVNVWAKQLAPDLVGAP